MNGSVSRKEREVKMLDGAAGEKLVFTVTEVRQLLGLSRNSVYEAVANGQLPAIRVGRRVLVPRAALERMLSEGQATTRD